MQGKANTTVPALAVAALLLGLADPAFADVPPRREHEKRTVEPAHAPPIAPPVEATPQPETEPPPQEAPEPTVQPTPEAAPPPPAKPEAKAEAKAADSKSGNCSIDVGSDQTLA